MEVCVGGLALDQIGAAVSTGEASADDLRGEAEISVTFTATEVRYVAGQELALGRGDR